MSDSADPDPSDPGIEVRARAAVEELSTLQDLVRWGASRLAEAEVHLGHGTDDPVDEALGLVLHGLALEPGLPRELWGARLTRFERERVVGLLTRRIRERVPAAYLTGRAWFCGLPFRVDERVLVPRSPLAEWIERGFEPWLETEQVHRVLDLGTGSGCIAIACAHVFPNARVDAVELSPDALEVARENVALHGLGERVRLREADLLDGADGAYDLIISNPPYVDAAGMANLPPEHRSEPAMALAAGDDGLDAVRRILRDAPGHVEPDGILVIEVGASRAAFEASFPQLPVTWLDCARGGEGVALVTGRDLAEAARAGGRG
jgi:ribosomal protein L3 glutamine methyltransferase